MLKRSGLLVAVALVLVGLSFWPERARADFGFAGRGGFGDAGIAGRMGLGGAGIGGAGIGGSFRLGVGTFGRPGFHHRRGGHPGTGAMLGNRFLTYQRARLTGKPLPSFVPIGNAELIAQRRRLDAKNPGIDRFRRFRHGGFRHRSGPAAVYFPWPLGVPGGGYPPVIVVQVAAPAPSEPAAQPDRPPQPLDPRGRIKVVDEERATDAWSPGDVLPDDVPQVTLDYAAYGLPMPPLGEEYARIGNDVLRIDAGTRRVTEVVAR